MVRRSLFFKDNGLLGLNVKALHGLSQVALALVRLFFFFFACDAILHRHRMSLQRNIAAEYDFFNGLLGLNVKALHA